MLPMYMMNAVVGFQMGQNPPLPPVEEMRGNAEALIAQWEDRLARIESAVLAVLQHRSAASLAALKDILSDIIIEDPNGAVRPQLENVCRAVVDIGEIYDATLKAVEQSSDQLAQKIRQHFELQVLLKQLQHTLKKGNDSQIRGFLKECADKGASYAATISKT